MGHSEQVRERKEKIVLAELRSMVPALKPRIDPVTGEEVLRQAEVWLPEKKVRAWNVRWAPPCALPLWKADTAFEGIAVCGMPWDRDLGGIHAMDSITETI